MEERIEIRPIFYSNLVCQLFEHSSVGSELPFCGNGSAPYLDDGVVKEIVIHCYRQVNFIVCKLYPSIKK